jgi:putative CocE/NonD family hydrolase
MATIDAHPAVVATSPQAPVSQWMGGDDFFHNGALLLPHAFDFFMDFGWPRTGPTENDSHSFNEGTPDEYQFYLNMGALPNANKLYAHDSVAFWNEILKHGRWDSWWEARDVLRHVSNLKPATMVVGGWFDTENLYGTLHLYARIKKGNARGRHTLVIGPWPHAWWGRDDVDSLGPFKFGTNLSDFYAKNIEVPYFDYYLRGKGEMNLPEAYVYETGANEWRTLPAWPPVNVKKQNLYFCKGGKLSFSEPPPTMPVFDEYVSDPARPVPYVGGIAHWYDASFMVADQRFASERPDVLTYETDPLQDTLTVAGPIEVHMVGSTSGTDCDWIVKLIDVFPDSAQDPNPNPLQVRMGGYQMLVRGDVARGKFSSGIARPLPLTPGKPANFNFVMNDVFHRFNKGHRLMVQVQSTWFPMIDRNPGKFENIFAAHDSDFVRTVQRVYRSPRNSSHLTFTVLN